jgi:tetratricopeptide (TPR) repeat protein
MKTLLSLLLSFVLACGVYAQKQKLTKKQKSDSISIEKKLAYEINELKNEMKKQREKELEEYIKIIELRIDTGDPTLRIDPHIWRNLRGYAYFELQNYAKAIEDWEAMKKVAPADYKPYYNYIDEARKKLAENNTIAELQKQLEEEKKKNEQVALLPSTHSKRLALVIGNDKYASQAPLANAQNDAMDMKKKLEDLGFKVLFYTNLDRVKMKNAIDDFGSKLASYDAGLVFYAGHGSQYKGENYLIPTDAVLQYENLVEDECWNVSRILRNMEGAQSKMNIIILDACRDNPYEKKWRSTNKIRGNKDNGGGLAKIEAENSQGLFIVFATSPDMTSMDFSPCENNTRNGLFTGKLLPNLQKGVRIEDVFKRTKKAVRECSQNMQNPWNHSSLEGDFVF